MEQRSESDTSNGTQKPTEQEQHGESGAGGDGMHIDTQAGPDASANELKDPQGVKILVDCLLSKRKDDLNPLRKFTPNLPFLVGCAIESNKRGLDNGVESYEGKKNRVLDMPIKEFAGVGMKTEVGMPICTLGMSLEQAGKAAVFTGGNFSYGSFANYGAICESRLRPDCDLTFMRPDPSATPKEPPLKLKDLEVETGIDGQKILKARKCAMWAAKWPCLLLLDFQLGTGGNEKAPITDLISTAHLEVNRPPTANQFKPVVDELAGLITRKYQLVQHVLSGAAPLRSLYENTGPLYAECMELRKYVDHHAAVKEAKQKAVEQAEEAEEQARREAEEQAAAAKQAEEEAAAAAAAAAAEAKELARREAAGQAVKEAAEKADSGSSSDSSSSSSNSSGSSSESDSEKEEEEQEEQEEEEQGEQQEQQEQQEEEEQGEQQEQQEEEQEQQEEQAAAKQAVIKHEPLPADGIDIDTGLVVKCTSGWWQSNKTALKALLGLIGTDYTADHMPGGTAAVPDTYCVVYMHEGKICGFGFARHLRLYDGGNFIQSTQTDMQKVMHDANRVPDGNHHQYSHTGEILALVSTRVVPGIGTKLINNMHDHLRGIGCTYCVLESLPGAIPFYEKEASGGYAKVEVRVPEQARHYRHSPGQPLKVAKSLMYACRLHDEHGEPLVIEWHEGVEHISLSGDDDIDKEQEQEQEEQQGQKRKRDEEEGGGEEAGGGGGGAAGDREALPDTRQPRMTESFDSFMRRTFAHEVFVARAHQRRRQIKALQDEIKALQAPVFEEELFFRTNHHLLYRGC
jgi:hypothetical protein